MKELPDTKTLIELLRMAKEVEEKARELYYMGEKLGNEWEEGFKKPATHYRPDKV
jgi:hypothetical protein